MRRWGMVLLLLLSLGVNLGVVGMLVVDPMRRKPPEPPPPPREEMPEMEGGDLIARLPRFADVLGLEGEKRQKFLDIHVAFFQDTTRLRLRMAEVHRNLRRQLSGEAPDAARVDSLVRESADVHLKLEQAFANCVLASRQLLGKEEERRYLQVVSRLRGAARGGPLELGPGPEGGPPEGEPLGPPNGFRPRPGGPRFRPEGGPPGGGPGWRGGAQGGGRALTPFERQRLQQWRRMQRQGGQPGQPPPRGKKPPPATPPPPVY